MNKKDNYIFFNGKIFTANLKKLYANAMVISDGVIIWIGEEKDLKNVDGKYIDLKGRRVVPGFIDVHMHPLFLANTLKQIPCVQPATNSIEELIEHIRKKRKEQGPNLWIQGSGYDEGKLLEGRSPNRWDLDKGASDVPVALMRTCFHIMVVNSKALKMAGIDRNTPDPPEGEIDRDLTGEPTGILRESAKNLITGIMPSLTMEESAGRLASLSSKLASNGITSIAECLANTKPVDYFDMYIRAREKGLKQRTVLYYDWNQLDENVVLDKDKLNNKNPIYIGGVKLLVDGSISGKTAWVDEPFLGNNEEYGLQTTSREELLNAWEFAKRNNIQIAVHAMGSKAVDLVIDTFYGKPGWLKDKPSIRIEHAAMATDKAISSAAEMGIAFVTQPIFMYAEIESYLKNLGADRTKKSYPIQSMLNKGVKVAFSSDAPATAWSDPSNPFVNLKAAVTRTAYDGTDCGQEHKVDIAAAIMMYTRIAQEITGISDVGQLSPGYHADFIVLDKDILEIDSDKIDEICVEETYMSGDLIYKR